MYEMKSLEPVTYFFVVPISIGLVLGYVGAFETGDILDGYDVITYWLPSVWVAWLLIYVATLASIRLLKPWSSPLLVSILAGCGLATLAISAEFFWYEATFFPELLPDIQDCTTIGALTLPVWKEAIAVYYTMALPAVILIAMPINLHFFRGGFPGRPHLPDVVVRTAIAGVPAEFLGPAGTGVNDEPPPHANAFGKDSGDDGAKRSSLYARLPKSLGTEILHLEAQQHYLKVSTALGSSVILYRLSDAVEELEDADGLRIHRSHWVRRSAVKKAERENGRLWLRLVTGLRVPVSRSYQLGVKDAGWLEDM